MQTIQMTVLKHFCMLTIECQKIVANVLMIVWTTLMMIMLMLLCVLDVAVEALMVE